MVATPGAAKLDGAALGLEWCLPFAGLLASIAILPLVAPHFWHRHFGKVAAFWALALLVPLASTFGMELALYKLVHTFLMEYVPFVALLLALFTIAGGIRITGTLTGSPAVNTGLLAVGTALASWMGTTGAAMLLIRPLLRANLGRRRKTHVFVFFIFLVGNIGGALTPLGDPPLLLGYLEGVGFFWVTTRMLAPMLALALPLLAVFHLLDRHYWRLDGPPARGEKTTEPLGLDGKRNLVLLLIVVAAVFLSGAVKTGVTFTVYHVEQSLESVVLTAVLLAVTGASLWITRHETRQGNEFDWFPMIEVAKLFSAIFIAMIAPLAIIAAGADGAAAPLLEMVNNGGRPDERMYFWVTGLLSGFLDNAPTYLIFFNLAGGEPATLMGPLAGTLLAISAGSVFMGAITYIGNAPNFLVKSVCEDAGVRMPSFFGYLLWAAIFLLPLFVTVSLFFFA